jgi:hypothetical protein
MSAPGLKVDLVLIPCDVAKVPEADMANLFDHLVGAGEQDLGNRDSQCFRRP